MIIIKAGGHGTGKSAAAKVWKEEQKELDKTGWHPTESRAWFWLSIRPTKKCLFGRRNGFYGKIIFGYSVRLRLFNRGIISRS